MTKHFEFSFYINQTVTHFTKNLKMHSITTLLLTFLFLFSVAQNNPWNAKFIIHHVGGPTDTVWFGCDTAADIGFQAGIDEFDTAFNPPISILAFDSVVNDQFGVDGCVNLRKDIKAFADGAVRFTFYVRTDSVDWPRMARISWDTLDFQFKNDSFELTLAFIETTYGYIEGFDSEFYRIYRHDSLVQHHFTNTPVDLIPEFPGLK